MLKKIATLQISAFITSTSLSAWYTAGKATGEAAEEIERGPEVFERGFEERRD